MEEEREQVEKNLRCVCASSKGGVRLKDLQRDYEQIVGDIIPFVKYGYRNLKDFLSTLSGITVSAKAGDIYVDVLPNKSIAHLQKLISRQKAPKKRVPKNPPRPVGRTSSALPQRSFNYSSLQNNRSNFRQIPPLMSIPLKHTIPETVKGTPNNVSNNLSNEKQSPLTTRWSPGEVVGKFNYLTTKQPSMPVIPRTEATQLPSIPQVQNPLSYRVQSQVPKSKLLPTPQLKNTNTNETTKTTKPVTIPDIRDDLRLFVLNNNLPEPSYTKHSTKDKIYAQVIIGSYRYSSYPQDAVSIDQAEKFAAEAAYLSLRTKLTKKLKETQDQELVKKRVTEIVSAHEGGVFEREIHVFYTEKYKESLPGNWLKIIEECSNNISIEKGANNSLILVLYTPPVTQLSDRVMEMPELQCPDEGEYWPLFVTFVESAFGVWARLGDENSDIFETMVNEMRDYYNAHKDNLIANSVQEGKYYAFFEGDYWHRVKCVKYNAKDNTAVIFFIDHGDEDNVDSKKLYVLLEKYYAVPAQALSYALSGLEEWAECEQIVHLIETHLLEKPCTFATVSRASNGDQSNLRFATFYSVEDDVNKRINVNENIAKDLILYANVIFPELTTEGTVMETCVTHITEEGEVYIQAKTDSWKIYKSLYNRLLEMKFINVDFQTNTENIDLKSLYFVRNSDGIWCRVRPVKTSPFNQIKVYLVDYGGTMFVHTKDLIPLKNISKFLDKYPEQAIKVELHNIPHKDLCSKITRFKELTTGDSLLMKIIKPAKPPSSATVELFKRIQPSNVLVSINNTLLLEPELFSQNDEENNNTRRRLTRKISSLPVKGNLKAPKVPRNSDDYFDVHVVLVANPGNFIVQPFETTKELYEMSCRLQEVCSKSQECFQTLDSIKEGDICAAKYTDGKWYRVCIKDIINEDQVTVYYCDYGDIAASRLADLKPLKEEFYELPYQAIRARLADVQPINQDWSVEDCLFFQEYVVNRNFVSHVSSWTSDSSSSEDIILSLKLIDTTTEDDIYVDELLISKGHASRLVNVS